MMLVNSSDWQTDLVNLDRCKIVVDQIVDILYKNNQKEKTFFLHLGDAKERFNPVDQRVTNFLEDSFRRIKASCSGFYYVRGNHDSITTQDGVPSCAPLIRAFGANAVADEDWVRVPIRLLTWNQKVVRFLLLYMVPFFRNPERQKQAFREAYEDALKPYKDKMSSAISSDNIRILAFHNEISGCKRSIYTKGEGLTQIDIGASAYDLCIGGHIHIPQTIGKNVIYVGSPFPVDWSEVNYEHRILTVSIPEDKP